MVKKKKEKPREGNPQVILDRLVDNLRSLEVFVRNVAPVALKHDKRAKRQEEEVIKRIKRVLIASRAESARKGGKGGPKEIGIEELKKIISAARALPRLPAAQAKLLYRSSFVMLVSYLDLIVSDLIHCYYGMHPEALSGKELSITLEELKVCKEVNEAIDLLVSKKVERVLYGGLEKQKEFLKVDLKIYLEDKGIRWNVINEAVERRNIIVHNDSRINRRYLENVDLSVVPEKRSEVKEGTQVNITEKYFEEILKEIIIVGHILVQCCWRKWKKDDANNADKSLINGMYEALIQEDWDVCERLGLFSKGYETKEASSKLYMDVNYCQSLKWQNKNEELERELEKFDVSTLSPKYRMSVCALRSDREGFYANVESAIAVDDMMEMDFMEWPLFRELRKDSEYETKIKEAFGGKR